MRLILALAFLIPLPAAAGLLATVEVEAAGISQNFTGEVKGDPKDYKSEILSIIRKYTAGKRTVYFELTMRPDIRGGDRVVYGVVMNVQDPEPRKVATLVMKGSAAFPLGRAVTVFADPGRVVKVRLDAITR